MSVKYKMNATNRTALKLMVVLYVAIVIITMMSKENYSSGRVDYRYGGNYDTNPARRVGGFFDTCSPENMEDCQRNNPYEGLPLP